MIFRLIIRVDSFGPDGTGTAPEYRTVDIRDENLERAMTAPGSYSQCQVIGCERIREAVGKESAP
jgi:hypothetical protein